MKTLFRALAVSFLLALSIPSGGVNPKPVPFADPYILCENGTYYLYGTHSDRGIAVMVSKDLRNWSTPDGSDTFLALNKKNSYGEKWFWAPEVYKIRGRYYMFYSSEEHVCMAVGDSPTGPFINDGAPILEEKGIDCSLYIDEDGTPYMFWVRFDGGNVIWVAQMTDDFRHIKPETMRFVLKAEEPWELDRGLVTEGPFCIRHKGVYYLTYSANDYRSRMYGVGYATARDLNGPWTKYEGNPVLQRPGDLYGTGHHSLFTDKSGRKRIVFHSHFSGERVQPRLCHISSYKFRRNKKGDDILVISPEYFPLVCE